MPFSSPNGPFLFKTRDIRRLLCLLSLFIKIGFMHDIL